MEKHNHMECAKKREKKPFADATIKNEKEKKNERKKYSKMII